MLSFVTLLLCQNSGGNSSRSVYFNVLAVVVANFGMRPDYKSLL